MPGEEWKTISFEPNYSVSNKGRVINNSTNRLMKFDVSHGGYQRVMIGPNRKRYMVHHLVYRVFNGDIIEEGYVIDHKDKNRANNCVENLEKVSIAENNLRRF